MFILKSLLSLSIAGAGVAVLYNYKFLSNELRKLYTWQFKAREDSLSFKILPLRFWDSPWFTFQCKAAVIFFGLWLIIVAYPAVFGAITIGEMPDSTPFYLKKN